MKAILHRAYIAIMIISWILMGLTYGFYMFALLPIQWVVTGNTFMPFFDKLMKSYWEYIENKLAINKK